MVSFMTLASSSILPPTSLEIPLENRFPASSRPSRLPLPSSNSAITGRRPFAARNRGAVGAAREEFVDEQRDPRVVPDEEETKAEDTVTNPGSGTSVQAVDSACEEGAKAEDDTQSWAATAAMQLLLHPYGAAHSLDKLGESATAAAKGKVQGVIKGAGKSLEDASEKVLSAAEGVKERLGTAVEGVLCPEAPARKDPSHRGERVEGNGDGSSETASSEAPGAGERDDIRADISGDIKGPAATAAADSTQAFSPSLDTFAEGVTTVRGGLGQQVQGLAESTAGRKKGEVGLGGGGDEGLKAEGENKREEGRSRAEESVERLKQLLSSQPKTE